MPQGTPVATLAVGKTGAINAALFAVRILALSSKELAQKVIDHKAQLKDEVLSADAKISE